MTNQKTIQFATRKALTWILTGFRPVILMPIALAATYWTAGGATMTILAAVLPAFIVLLSILVDRRAGRADHPSPITSSDTAETFLEEPLIGGDETIRQLAVLAISVDNLELLEERVGKPMDEAILLELHERLSKFVRREDFVSRGIKSDFLVCITGLKPPESENLLHLSRRIQGCLDDPFENGSVCVYCSISIGIARAIHLDNPTPHGLIRAAEGTNREARHDGPGSVRIHKSTYGRIPNSDTDLVGQIAPALENGQIIAWYQPQISTHSGEITGFEALARWEHPTRGLISPATFLHLIDRLGLSQRLAEVVLTHALSTLRTWDRAGFSIPSVSVNYSADELRNPRLPEYLRWELDRYELTSDRLTIEVLENVIADNQDDTIAKNLRAISKMGCRIDLDDFGTGYTSILNIRTFAVSRLKIDRRLISRIDADQDQRVLVSALLAMSERLGIETLAEGVETPNEHAMLAQLGCDHIQGFGLARPMPRGDSLTWITDYQMNLPTRQVLPTQTAK